MNTTHPSPVSPMGLEEYFWLRGTPVVPLDPRASTYFDPPELDPQHSSCVGSERRDPTPKPLVDPWKAGGWCVVMGTLFIFWSCLAWLLAAVWRWVL